MSNFETQGKELVNQVVKLYLAGLTALRGISTLVVDSFRNWPKGKTSYNHFESTKPRRSVSCSDRRLSQTETFVKDGIGALLGELLASLLSCRICQGVFSHAMTLGCSHSFCKSCIREVFKELVANYWLPRCPTCYRFCHMTRPPVRNVILEKLVVDHLADCSAAERKKSKALRMALIVTAARRPRAYSW